MTALIPSSAAIAQADSLPSWNDGKSKQATRLVVAAAIVERIEELDPKFPSVDDEQRRAMAKARRQFEAGGDDHGKEDGRDHD